MLYSEFGCNDLQEDAPHFSIDINPSVTNYFSGYRSGGRGRGGGREGGDRPSGEQKE